MHRCVIIIPCYNEAARIDGEGYLRLLSCDSTRLILVDDGSTDATFAQLQQVAARVPTRVELLHLPRNMGKGEAVRLGMQRAIAAGAEVVGYLDADLAAPPSELLRMLSLLDETSAQVLLGSRVKLLGRYIVRHAWRHYLGRVFATFASLTLGMPVYDTQCGAKLFRVTPQLLAALQTPFHSHWVFDVELIGRLYHGAQGVVGLDLDAFYEVPLYHWRDVQGSKLNVFSAAGAALDLAVIALALRRHRTSSRVEKR